MADTKLVDLDPGNAEGTDIVYAVKDPSGVSLDRKIALSNIKDYILGGSPPTFTDAITVRSADTGASAAPDVILYRDSASPADNDILGQIKFDGEDSAGNQQTYGTITGQILDEASTSEDGALLFGVVTAGTLANEMRLDGAALSPVTSDGNALGTSSLMWSDLFLASGAVVNFNNGDVTLTHSADTLTMAGGNLSLGTTASLTTGTIELGAASDTTLSRSSAGVAAVEGKPIVTTTGAQTVEFAAGTVSAPGITFSADTNTGFFRPAADTLAAATGGVERWRLTSAGNVGIGTTPFAGAKIQIKTATNNNLCFIDGTNGPGFYCANDGNSTLRDFFIQANDIKLNIGASNVTCFQVQNTGVARLNLLGAGTLTTDASGNITATSDERLKDDIQPWSSGLAEIEQINPISYKWSVASGLDRLNTYCGFSAQNVEAAIPEAIGVGSDGYMGVDLRPILAAAVNAIKELSSRNAALEARIAALEAA